MSEEKEIHIHSGNQDASFWFGLFLGGLIGGVLIYLLGTKEGRKLSDELQGKGEGWLAEVEKKLHDLEKHGGSLVEKGEALKEHILDKAEGAKEHLSDDVVTKVDKALEHIEKLQERGRSTTSQIRKRLFKNTPKK